MKRMTPCSGKETKKYKLRIVIYLKYTCYIIESVRLPAYPSLSLFNLVSIMSLTKQPLHWVVTSGHWIRAVLKYYNVKQVTGC